MLKQIIYIIIASALVILGAKYLEMGFDYLTLMHSTLIHWFSTVFSSSWLGELLTKVLALFLIPLIITGIVAGIYWIFKRKVFPAYIEVLWALWIILATLLVIHSAA